MAQRGSVEAGRLLFAKEIGAGNKGGNGGGKGGGFDQGRYDRYRSELGRTQGSGHKNPKDTPAGNAGNDATERMLRERLERKGKK